MNLIVSSIGQGLLWALLGLGLYLTFRILDFCDMTVEGTFPLGAATAGTAISNGVNPFLATLLAILAGMIAGLITGLLYTKGKIPSLLAGILTMTAIYSVDLRIMGKSNISLLGKPTLFNGSFLRSLPQYFDSVTVGLIVIIIVTVLMMLFLATDYGQGFIATGDNPTMAKSLGIHTDSMINVGLMVSNGMVALCGALVAQSNGYADIGMGIGTIVIGLASVLVGEIFLRGHNILTRLIAMVVGAIVYRLLLTVAMSLGFPADDLKILSAIILVIVICVPIIQNKIQTKRQLKKYLQQMEAKDDESTTSAAPTKSLLSRD